MREIWTRASYRLMIVAPADAMIANYPPVPAFPLPGDLLPHRPPMLLLRSVLSHQADTTCCEARLGGWQTSAAFGLELIAQTAAVHHALCELARQKTHVRAERGLLLGSRRLHLAVRDLLVDEPLKVTVTGGQEPPGPGGLIRFEGHVEDAAGRVLVSGDATVLEWRPDTQAV